MTWCLFILQNSLRNPSAFGLIHSNPEFKGAIRISCKFVTLNKAIHVSFCRGTPTFLKKIQIEIPYIR